MFIATLFTRAKNWKQPICSWPGGWINKPCYIRTMEYSLAVEWSHLLMHGTMWMNLRDVMLLPPRRAQMTVYSVSLFICNYRRGNCNLRSRQWFSKVQEWWKRKRLWRIFSVETRVFSILIEIVIRGGSIISQAHQKLTNIIFLWFKEPGGEAANLSTSVSFIVSSPSLVRAVNCPRTNSFLRGSPAHTRGR